MPCSRSSARPPGPTWSMCSPQPGAPTCKARLLFQALQTTPWQSPEPCQWHSCALLRQHPQGMLGVRGTAPSGRCAAPSAGLPGKAATLYRRLGAAGEPAVHLLSRMLIFDPDRRCSAEEALAHEYFAGLEPWEDDTSEGQPPAPCCCCLSCTAAWCCKSVHSKAACADVVQCCGMHCWN